MILIKRLKRIFGVRDLIVFCVGVVFSAFFTFLAYRPGIVFNLINFTFCMGIFHVLVGLCVIVKNLGLFKAFGYMHYKRSFRRHGKTDPTVQPLSFGEYVMSSKRYSYREHIFVGIPFVLISILLLLLQ